MSTERKTETIDIGKGIQYAKVASRSAEFHKDNEKCSIETTCEFKEGYALFCAKVTTSKGTFTGHSMDKVSGRQKQFEKQETIAVGRALAFAGYLATGDIACAEEMEDVITETQLNSLKGKYATVHAAKLKNLPRDKKLAEFSSWCRELTGETANYADRHAWNREWYEAAWKALIGVASDVPFEE
jgi:hypothetical protein